MLWIFFIFSFTVMSQLYSMENRFTLEQNKDQIYCLMRNCKQRFESLEKIMEHFERQHYLFFSCECSKKFQTISALNNHKKKGCEIKHTHTKKSYSKQIMTSFCLCMDTKAKTFSGLAKHVQTFHYNSLESKFFCPGGCSYQTDSAPELVRHLANHHQRFIITRGGDLKPRQRYYLKRSG